jgi:hypothetical protein
MMAVSRVALMVAAPMVAVLLGLSPAQAQTAAPALDPAQAAAKTAFERLDEAERKAVQNDLIWTGDFTGVASGEFGRRTYDGLLAFERRTAGSVDGILAAPERARLRRDADAARAAMRFEPVTDPATGVRIGLPQALLTARVAVENGVVWRRADGQVSLQLTRLPPAADFPALFERMRADQPGRKVTYRLLRPDWFVLSGEEGARRFYTRIAQGPDGLRGYTFRYPAAEAATMERVMIALANSFEPFPAVAAVAATPQRPAPAQPPVSAPPATAVTGIAPHAIAAVAIAPGRLLTTSAAWRSCAEPRLAGRLLAADSARVSGEATTIEVTGVTLMPARIIAAAGQPAHASALSFDPAMAGSVMASPGRLEHGTDGLTLSAAVQLAPGGAPVLDASGALIGLVREGARERRLVAGVVPQARYAVVPASMLSAGIGEPTTAATGPGLAGWARSLVQIGCGPAR